MITKAALREGFKATLKSFIQAYFIFCILCMTTLIVLLAIFGGDFHVAINFDSWSKLMESLKH